MKTRKGYICYDSKKSEILCAFDKLIQSYAEKIGAETFTVPTMIDYNTLKLCGYLTSVPHQLSAVSRVSEFFYDEVIKKNEITDRQMVTTQNFLNPAVCLHVYPMFQNADIDSKIITVKSRAYRYEGAALNDSTRLWDFTVREIIFMGSDTFVLSQIQLFEKFILDLCTSIGLQCHLAAASDHFYPSVENIVIKKFQRTNHYKKEILTAIEGKDVALGSLNFHGTRFSKIYHFDKKSTVVSGCVGVGLERWVTAITQNTKLQDALLSLSI